MKRLAVPVHPWRGYRLADDFGSGAYGASRDGGLRQHAGQDYRALPGDDAVSPVEGKVSRILTAYPDSNLRGVLITGTGEHLGLQVKMLYLEPTVTVGQKVAMLERLGTVQDVAAYHQEGRPGKTMTNHLHVEVWVADDPKRYVVEPPPNPVVA